MLRLIDHTNTAKDYRRARELRNNASPIENKLWVVLREAAKTAGLKFRRQQAIHPYIADFACMEIKLLIEVDGDSHVDTIAYDKKREAKLQEMGFSILHFSNDDVVKNVEGVVGAIMECAMKQRGLLLAPFPNLPRKGEGTLFVCAEDSNA